MRTSLRAESIDLLARAEVWIQKQGIASSKMCLILVSLPPYSDRYTKFHSVRSSYNEERHRRVSSSVASHAIFICQHGPRDVGKWLGNLGGGRSC